MRTDQRLVRTNEDKGPMFFLVYTISAFVKPDQPSVWTLRAYWSMGEANTQAASLKARGRMAFVEAR